MTHTEVVGRGDSTDALSTVFARCRAELASLVEAIHSKAAAIEATRFLDRIVPWLGDRSTRLPPLWSCVCDDASPYELSVATRRNGEVAVRLLVEAHSKVASARAYWARASELTGLLSQHGMVDARPFERLEDLFEPRTGEEYFACYHGFEFAASGGATCKVYLNPRARGTDNAPQLLRAAAERFGVQRAWAHLERQLPATAGLILVSVDLVNPLRSRFKVYVRLWNCAPSDLQRLCSLSGERGEPGVVEFAEVITGSPGPLDRRPIFAVFHLQRERETPAKVVVDIPFLPYARNDALAQKRMLDALRMFDVPSEAYARAVRAIGPADLGRSIAFHSYASLQRDAGEPRITAYFCPVLYGREYGLIGARPPKNFWSETTQRDGQTT